MTNFYILNYVKLFILKRTNWCTYRNNCWKTLMYRKCKWKISSLNNIPVSNELHHQQFIDMFTLFTIFFVTLFLLSVVRIHILAYGIGLLLTTTGTILWHYTTTLLHICNKWRWNSLGLFTSRKQVCVLLVVTSATIVIKKSWTHVNFKPNIVF